jgi:tripartite-type tricarboxylate transporter receptor subunit TctC
VVQFGEKRASFLPDTATAIENGIASLHAYSWFGFFGPAGTPKPILDRFYRDVAAAVRDEANYTTLVNKFRVEVPLPAPDELRQMIVEELPFWAKIIRDNNIKVGT